MGFEIVFNRDDPPEQCGGGKSFEECGVSQELLRKSINFFPDRSNFNFEIWNRLNMLQQECGQCALRCSISVRQLGRKQTGEVRMDYDRLT